MKLRIALVGLLALVAAGCGSTPYMREALPNEVLTAPPPGKVLVNFNRDSGYGGHRAFAFWDGTKFIGCNEGVQRVQYVCEPGEHTFIGYLTDSIWATVSVIPAELEADRVYDMIVDIGYFTAQIAMNPIKRGDPRRENFPDWDVDQDTLVLDPETGWQEYEADQKEDNQEILSNFQLEGKKDPKRTMAPDDHRDAGPPPESD